jgi:hypothetical protein
MNLLGPYSSNLAAFSYQELVSLLQQAIAAGEYAGGTLFDSESAAALQSLATSFASLPLPSAEERAIADQVNTPLNLLIARYNAITSEVSDFQTQLNNLLSILYKDSYLIVQTLNASIGNNWAAQQPIIAGAIQFSWDFSAGYGNVTFDIPRTDPSNGVEYDTILPLKTLFNGTDIVGGLAAPSNDTQFAVKNLNWVYSFNAQTETASGDDWTEFSLLANAPLMTYSSTPQMSTVIPIGGDATQFFIAGGQSTVGNLPIYVQISFIERARVVSVNAVANQSVQLSSYTISVTDSAVYSPGVEYVLNTDYTLTNSGQFTPLASLNGLTVNVLVSEFYPAYQCSINQNDWSLPVMLDTARLYPDNTTEFVPVDLITTSNGSLAFPVTDEDGVSLGLWIQMIAPPDSEMVFSIASPAAPSYGAQAELDVEFEKPGYMTGFNLGSFTNFPPTLTGVVLEGLVPANNVALPMTPVVLNQETTLTFPTQLVRRVRLLLTQTNYSLKEYQATAPDALRRDTLANLQAVLPFAIRNTQPALPVFYEGAEYDFGIENLYGLLSEPRLPGVFIVGPFNITGVPEILRLDTQTTGDVDTYLTYQSFDANGNQLADASAEIPFLPATSMVFPPTDSAIYSVTLYLKFVLRDQTSMVSRYLLQATVA